MDKGNGFTMKDASEGTRDQLKISFSSFILSLYSSGLVQLGKVEDPSNGKKSINLELAKHTIEMVAMLQEKTKGNLTEDENNLLVTLLAEIRIAYVEAQA